MSSLSALGVPVRIRTMPNELPDPDSVRQRMRRIVHTIRNT